MRGWLHTYAFFVAVVCGIVLCSIAATRPGSAPFVSCLIYSLTVCGLFGTSALYHRRVWSERGYQIMRRMDHSMIFMFIAGTYTPFCVLLLPPGRPPSCWRWSGAARWPAWPSSWSGRTRRAGSSAPLYLALGWVAVAMLPDILHGGRRRRAGAAGRRRRVYSVGAVFYALRRPNPWPTVFGHHEFFHACTLVAALCHHIAIYFALYA